MPSSHATDGGASAPQPPGERADAPAQQAPEDRTAALEARNAQLEDRYKRALADLDNYRKRVARDTDRRVADAREGVVMDWLEAVDSVDRALQQMAPEDPSYAGLRAVLDQLESILARQGVTRVGERGEPFDAERHDAIGVRETTDAPDRAITDVARSGFALGDRVVRPAQVIVARAPAGGG